MSVAGGLVLPEAVAPEVAQLLDADRLVLEFPAALLADHPLDVVVGGQQHLEEHDAGRVDPDGDQHDALLGLSGHEEVDVEEEEGEDGVVEQPVGDEGDLLDEVALDAFARVALGAPADVVDVAEGVDEHHVGVGALVGHVADAVPHQLEHEDGVGRQVHQGDDHVAGHVNAGDHEYQSPLWVVEELSEAVNLIELQIDSHHVEDDQGHEEEGVKAEDVGYVVGVLGPLRPEEAPRHAEDYHEDVYEGEDLSSVLDDVVGARLHDCGVEGEDVEGRDEVAVHKGQKGEEHGEAEEDVLPEEAVARLHGVVVVVAEDVEEGEVAAVDPPSPLDHQLLVGLHGVGEGHRVGHVLQKVLPVLLAVYAQGEDAVLGQVHVGLAVVALLVGGVQDHLEVLALKQVLLEFLTVDESLVAVARPGSWQHVQEAECALEALVDEVRNDVLELLRLLDREQALGDAALSLFLLPLLGLKVSIHTHETCDSSHVLVRESLKVLQNSQFRGLGPHIEQDADLWVELTAEALEKPEVGAEFGAVGVLEAADDFEFVGVVGVGTPQVLVHEGEVLLDGGREVAVVLDEVPHPFPFEVVHLVQDNVDPLVQVALLLALAPVQLPVELHHRMLILDECPPHPVLDQFEQTVLNQYNCDIVLRHSILSQRGQVGVDTFQSGLDGVATLVVHADAYDDSDAFEVVPTVLAAFAELAQVVHQPV